jgi:hypothetical protein
MPHPDWNAETTLALIKRRPKIALRRIRDPWLRLAIKSYDLNRRTQAEAKTFEYVCELVRGGK